MESHKKKEKNPAKRDTEMRDTSGPSDDSFAVTKASSEMISGEEWPFRSHSYKRERFVLS